MTTLTAGSTPSPLVNTNFSDIALISQQQNNLSVTGAIPLSNGPGDPSIRSGPFRADQRAARDTPEDSTVLTGSNWLAQNDVNANAGWTQGSRRERNSACNFDNSRYFTNANRYTYNPFVNSSLGFTITQPLLQGFGTSLNRRYIRIARNSQKVADLVFRQQVIDTVAGVARLYTDLVSLNEDVKVKQ